MTIEVDLVAWAAARPDWQRDILIRLCQQETFHEGAIEDIADRLIAGTGIPARALTPADISGDTVTAGGVQFAALHDLTGVNALASDQKLTFGAAGITIIYGDNGSGKSGYARILKSAAGARIRADILGDVFARTSPTPQSAVIDYRVAGAGRDQKWEWSRTPNPQLQQAHFYDEAEGDAYLSSEFEIMYRPSALVLLDQLIAVCDAVRGVLDQRLRDTDRAKPTLPDVPKDTRAYRLLAGLKSLAGLDPETAEATIEELCAVAPDASENLARLLSEEARLKASDPTKERDRLAILAGRIETIATYCDRLAAALTADAIGELGKLRTSAMELRTAAMVASSQNFDAEPVGGVGSTTWRALWEAARTFSETEAYHGHEFPVTGDVDRCVLCQQVLSPEAGDRLRRFQAFMTATTERDAVKAERRLATARQSLSDLAQIPAAVVAAGSQLRAADASLADTVDTWTTIATARARAAVDWIDRVVEASPEPVPEGPGKTLTDYAQQMREQAAEIDATSFAEQLNAASAQVAELQGQTALSASKVNMLAEVRRLRARARIEVARKATDTGAITRKSSDLTRDHVTREVRDQFTRESERLRLSRITLDDTSGVKGRLLHRPALLGAVRPAAVTKVLSEGEQTALGLSGFFTEVVFDTSKSAVVLDDPVTSLDHERRSLVAKRLVELAADRQIVVFTHERHLRR